MDTSPYSTQINGRGFPGREDWGIVAVAREVSAWRWGMDASKDAFVTGWQRSGRAKSGAVALKHAPWVELVLWASVSLCYNNGVFGLSKPNLPITSEQQRWVDQSFVRLAGLVGAHRLLHATVVLPTPQDFPDLYDRSEIALQRMFHRVATQMRVNPDDVDVTLFASGDDLTRGLVPFYSEKSSGPPAYTTTTPLTDRKSRSTKRN
jgi:hypothetical protein